MSKTQTVWACLTETNRPIIMSHYRTVVYAYLSNLTFPDQPIKGLLVDKRWRIAKVRLTIEEVE